MCIKVFHQFRKTFLSRVIVNLSRPSINRNFKAYYALQIQYDKPALNISWTLESAVPNYTECLYLWCPQTDYQALSERLSTDHITGFYQRFGLYPSPFAGLKYL